MRASRKLMFCPPQATKYFAFVAAFSYAQGSMRRMNFAKTKPPDRVS